MGIFFNEKEHPKIFRSEAEPAWVNQSYYKRNKFEEYFENQREINERIEHSLDQLSVEFLNWEKSANLERKTFHNQLGEITNYLAAFNRSAQEQLNALEKRSEYLEEILAGEIALNKHNTSTLEQIIQSQKQSEEKVKQLQGGMNDFEQKMNIVFERQEQLGIEMEKQIETQAAIFKEVENHSALLEKMARQFNHLLSVLFERTNFIVEKVEKGLKDATSFLFIGSGPSQAGKKKRT